MPFAEAALDVDKEADRLAVEEVFAERMPAGSRANTTYERPAAAWQPVDDRKRRRR